MKKNIFCFLIAILSLFITGVNAQNVAINEDGSLPNPNAILDVKSFTKGVLIPRVSTSGRLLIPATKGLLVYDTTTSSFWYNTGAVWQSIATDTSQGTGGWSLTGNGGTTDSNFIGTTDLRPLIIKVNNQPAGRIDPVSSSGLNTFLGAGAGSLSTGEQNSALGAYSLAFNYPGRHNTANGAYSLFLNQASYNTAVGHSAMFTTQGGGANSALGYRALYDNISGSANTAVGLFALSSVTSGGSNTGIGAYTSIGGIGNLNNATAIGFNAFVNASNKVRIGNTVVTAIEGAVPFTTLSDGRFKNNVQEDVKGLDFILQLRPVTYNFDAKRFDEKMRGNKRNDSTAAPIDEVMKAAYTEATAIRRTGFIAQEVEKAAFSSGYDFSGILKPQNDQDHYSLSYEAFVVPLVKAVQEQQQLINELRKEIAELKRTTKK